MSIKTDELDEAKIAEVAKKIPEEILFIKKIIKFSKKKYEQERIIAITKTSIYHLQKMVLKRTVTILSIQGISFSLKSNQFTFHIPSQYDIRYKSISRDKIIYTILKNRDSLGDTTRIPLFAVQNQYLDDVTTTQDDIKKGKRKSVQSQHHMVTHKNYSLQIHKYFSKDKNTQILYVSEDHLSNLNQSQYKTLMKIGSSLVCCTKVIKCFKKNEVLVMKTFRKKYLSTDIDKFRESIVDHSLNKFTEKLLFAQEKQSQFQLIFQYYRGDMYGQLKAQATIDEVLLLHICVRTLFVIKEVDYVLKTLNPQNILINSQGNSYLSILGSYFLVDYPEQYCSPQELKVFLLGERIKYIQMVNIWKLGVTIFQLAYGMPPFRMVQILSTMTCNREFKVRFPRTQKSGGIQDFLSSILKMNPEDRLGFGEIEDIFKCEWFRSIDIRRYRDTAFRLEKYVTQVEIEDNYCEPIEYYYNN